MTNLHDTDQAPYSAPVNDGGAAFPVHPSLNAEHYTGMTLRDYVAVKALAAIIIADGIQYVASHAKGHAELALMCADTFIAAREVRK